MTLTSDSPASITASRTLALARGASSGGGDITLPEANLYRQTFESKIPDVADLNTINFNFIGLYNNLGTDLDGGTTGGIVNTGNGIIDPPTEVPGVDWRSYEGDIHMRVRLGTQTGTSNPEQNAEFDVIPGRDVWHRYWMRIPTNYAPTTNHINSQHKLFVIFQDAYSNDGDGSTCWMNIYYESATGYMRSAIIHSNGGFTNGGGPSEKVDLFHSVNDRGRWMQFVFLHRLESSPGASDGEQRFWVRFHGESAFRLQNARAGITLKRSTIAGLEGWRRCRFSSAREGDSSISQDLLFDVIEVADQPLVPAGTEGL